jgi:putative addiction module component (TIGR02574 family)
MLTPMAIDKLKSAVLSLPASERADLAQALLESLHQDGEADAEAVWLSELDRRAQAVAGGTATVVDWEDARKRISDRLKARRANRTPR